MAEAPASKSEGGAPEWMVSYADMITIVLAFFVVLYATTSGIGQNDRGHEANTTGAQQGTKNGTEDANDKSAQLQKIINSLNERFGPSWTLSNCWAGGPVAQRKKVESKIDSFLRGFRGGQEGGNSTVKLFTPKANEHAVPGGCVFFEEFSATLDKSQQHELLLIAEDLAGKLQKIEIRGHASHRPLPKNSPWKNPWELAFARCQTVAGYLSVHDVDSRRFRIAVAADNEPIDALGNPTFGEKNSRVEVRLLNEWIDDEKNPQARADRPGAKNSTELTPKKSPPQASPADAAKDAKKP
jgi:chemotaxis protein MotB